MAGTGHTRRGRRRTATHSIVAKDRNTHHVVEVVELPSYEEATRNSNLPETNRIFEEIVALCTRSHCAQLRCGVLFPGRVVPASSVQVWCRRG